MSEIKRMRHLLEEMVEAADVGDVGRVAELSKSYNALLPKDYLGNPLYSEYDLCAGACVASVGVLKDQHDKLVADAKERLSKIPEPED